MEAGASFDSPSVRAYHPARSGARSEGVSGVAVATKRLKSGLAGAMLCVGLAGLGGHGADAATAASAARADKGGALVFAAGSEKLNTRQKLEFADEALKEMRDSVRRVERMAEDARRQKDIILLNCLYGRLASLRALLKIGEQASTDLRLGLEKENADLVDEQFRRLAVARERAVQESVDADACVGETESSETGTGGKWSASVSDVAGEIPEDYGADPSGYARPPEATPWH